MATTRARSSSTTLRITITVLLALAGLVACDRSRRRPVGPSAEAATAAPQLPAGAHDASRPADAAPAAPQATDDNADDALFERESGACDRGGCDLTTLPQLYAGVAQMFTAPTAAMRSFRASRIPLARAYRLYLEFTAGHAAEAQRLHNQLWDAIGESDGQDRAADLTSVLTIVRQRAAHVERADGFRAADLPRLVPCELFARHPRESLAAFRGNNDEAAERAVDVREACARLAVSRLSPSTNLHELAAAIRAIAGAMSGVRRMPTEGSIYPAVEADADGRLWDVFLAPPDVAASDARLTQAIDDASRDEPAVRRRVPAFRRVLEQQVPVLAVPVCAIAAARGHALAADPCAAMARAAGEDALAVWVGQGIDASPASER